MKYKSCLFLRGVIITLFLFLNEGVHSYIIQGRITCNLTYLMKEYTTWLLLYIYQMIIFAVA